ncbi:WecB/TagA/CpsF family glycosyltransferase [Kiritimatiellaeota bacterium B1221]|nr:WecB/TagA/CpsF family glycosyltransferase [Kiritimatiellaeota bacterium B1221]
MNPTDIPLMILGVPFHAVDNQQTLDWCLEHVSKGKPGYVATPNLDFVMQAGKDPELYRILIQADLVIADGMPIVWLSKLLGPKLPERVAGSDLVLSLSAGAARKSFSVFNLGGASGVPEKAGAVMTERFPGFKLAGAYSPPKADLLEMNHEEILQKISDASPDILYVAFGAPKQEKWINMHFRNWNVPLALGIGASLDFLAGAQTRAPKWMQKSGTEWIWRLGTNPVRLWKRYTSNFVFLFKSLSRIKRIQRRDLEPCSAHFPPEELANLIQTFTWTPLQIPARAASFIDEISAESFPRNLLLDLSDATWLNSLELGTLLTLGNLAKTNESKVLLTGVAGRLKAWIEMNGLTPLLQFVKEDEDWQAYGVQEIRSHTALSPTYGTLRLIPPAELTVVTLPEWKEKTQQILSRRSEEIKRIELDCAKLTFLDSAGLGYLMRMRKEVHEASLEWAVLQLNGAPLLTIQLARVEKILLSEKLNYN